jgi:glycosyltransferase involved in cell wall biosynthesis
MVSDRATHRPRVAFVVQRYGVEVSGGAERLCREVAERLAAGVDVHVLTTCALDYSVWANHYPPGEMTLNGVTVHRYPTRPARPTLAGPADGRDAGADLLGQMDWLVRLGPYSPELLAAIDAGRATYDAFIFYTYLYLPTVLGLHLVPERAILVPTAHDEPQLYLNLYRSVFWLPQVILYNSAAERDLVHRVFGNAGVPHLVVGVGVEEAEGNAERFRARHGLTGDILLYVGRIDRHKGVDELLDHFARYREGGGRTVTLVLVGMPVMPVPPQPDVVVLNILSEQEKADALAAAAVVVVPPRFESLSMVTLEAWRAGKAVLANAECEVVRQLCLEANGGLFYADSAEFAVCLDRLLSDEPARTALGLQGQRYVTQRYTWDLIETKYRAALAYVGVDVPAGLD